VTSFVPTHAHMIPCSSTERTVTTAQATYSHSNMTHVTDSIPVSVLNFGDHGSNPNPRPGNRRQYAQTPKVCDGCGQPLNADDQCETCMLTDELSAEQHEWFA
jgi:hypothetical protein